MMARMMDALFGCWHARYSFPITVRRGTRRSKAASVTGTYVVCLDCGKEMPYDWQHMKVLTSQRRIRSAMRLAAKQAA